MKPALQRAQAMLNMTMVAVLTGSRPGVDLLPLLDRHFDFMIDLERRGLLFLSGPMQEDAVDAANSGHGLTVLNVRTIAEARALWEGEPFQLEGLRDARFFLWNIMEGSLRLTAELSSQSLRLERPPEWHSSRDTCNASRRTT
ncbi:MAG: hypothetical protein V4724_06860 [Pseudomonadota bacterium]